MENVARTTEWALRHAGRESDKASFNALVKRVDRHDADRMMLLHAAAAFGHLPKVVSLLEMGADVATQDSDGSSPLHVASSTAEVEVMKVLLRAGAAVEQRNKHGETALHLACLNVNSPRRKTNNRYVGGCGLPFQPTEV